ncbi:MAG TPA: hypothetical protein VGH23_02070 [Rhizomicrobium sp.]|jgi:hypothetical protein
MTQDAIKNAIDFAQLIATIVGAIGIAWYWSERNNKLAEYRYLDESYSKLLELYRTNPEFGDKRRTDDYARAFQGDVEFRYHYFAMTVHSVMESIFDTYKSHIPKEWGHIFVYHTSLHLEWLRDNPGANEPRYVAHVIALHGNGVHAK